MERKLDYSYIGPYLEDWLKYIKMSSKAEQKTIRDKRDFRVPYAAMQPEITKAIFVISDRFKIEAQAKHMACHLFDKYVNRLFWELVISSGEKSLDKAVAQARQKMLGQMKLVLATCVQIASKVDLFNTGLCITEIQDLLQSIDPKHEYTRANIFSSELRILKTLDYRLPVCLPIHILELLVPYSKITQSEVNATELRETCIRILDIAYLRHEEIFEQLHLLLRGKSYKRENRDCRNFMLLESNAGFIAASVIVCSNFFFCLPKKVVDSLVARVSRVIEEEVMNVTVMANVLFTLAIDEEDFKKIHRGERSDIE